MGLAEKDERLYFCIAFSVLSISGIAIAWRQRTLFVLSSVVAFPAIAMQWITLWAPVTAALGLWRQGMTLVAILMLVLVQMLEVFRFGPVTHWRIQGAVAVYLLLGMGWAHAYHMAAILNPRSFDGLGNETSAISAWMYYSFVTLTTVGYGDIVPVRPVARSLAIGEAITGQLYLTVLLARLVALQISRGSETTRKARN
jgi:hypothetical protein